MVFPESTAIKLLPDATAISFREIVPVLVKSTPLADFADSMPDPLRKLVRSAVSVLLLALSLER